MAYKSNKKRYIYGKYYFKMAGKAPIPLNMDGSPRKGISNVFYDTFKEWLKLPNREDYRVTSKIGERVC